MMKVLHVVNVPFVLPYFFGEQINYLKSKGMHVTIACSKDVKLDDFVTKYDINKFEVDIVRRIDLKTDLQSVFQLARFIKKEKFDFVIGHTPKGALLAMISSRIAKTKNRVYFRHGLVYETSTGLKLKLMVFLEKLTSFLATKIVSVSNSVLEISLKNNFGSRSKNIILNKGTCNGVDVSRFTKLHRDENSVFRKNLGVPEDNIIIGFVGRLVKDKGIQELVLAWKELLKKRSNISLLLVGPIEERDRINDEVESFLKNEPSIFITGLVENTRPFYSIMDIFILPSYREGFPTVVLEASSMELPIITTKATGCIDSIVEDVTGIYCSHDSEDIANSIQYYIENPLKRIENGKEGRKWVMSNFDQEVVWESIMENIYK